MLSVDENVPLLPSGNDRVWMSIEDSAVVGWAWSLGLADKGVEGRSCESTGLGRGGSRGGSRGGLSLVPSLSSITGAVGAVSVLASPPLSSASFREVEAAASSSIVCGKTIPLFCPLDCPKIEGRSSVRRE